MDARTSEHHVKGWLHGLAKLTMTGTWKHARQLTPVHSCAAVLCGAQRLYNLRCKRDGNILSRMLSSNTPLA